MKKVLFIIIAAVMLSCSKDEIIKEVPVNNYMRVITLSTGSAPGQPLQYFVTYGTSSEDQVYTEISQQVYSYYANLANQSPNPRWRGEVTE